jgi:hypothetical protein
MAAHTSSPAGDLSKCGLNSVGRIQLNIELIR